MKQVTRYYTCDICNEPCDPVEKITLIDERKQTPEGATVLELEVKFDKEYHFETHICKKCLFTTLKKRISEMEGEEQ